MAIRWRGVNHHFTTDAVSPSAMKLFQVGQFPPGYSGVCNCMASNGAMKSKDCDGLSIYDADGDKVVQFWGKQFRGRQDEDGNVAVWVLPSVMMQTQDHRPCRDTAAHEERSLLLSLQDALVKLNKKNEEFYRRSIEE